MKSVLFVMTPLTVVYICRLALVSGKMCTDTLSGQRIEEVSKQQKCTEKFTARCGWLSLNYCTFYRSTMCERKFNETKTYYYIKTDCCPGYIMLKNMTCIMKVAGKDYSAYTVAPDIEDTNAVKLGKSETTEEKKSLSVGGYAGIICGFVFFAAVIAFTVVAVRKRKKRQEEKPPLTSLQVEYSEQTQSLKPLYQQRTSLEPLREETVREETPLREETVREETPLREETVREETPLREETVREESCLSKDADVGPEVQDDQSEALVPDPDRTTDV